MDGDCATGTVDESWAYAYDGDGVRVSTLHDDGSQTLTRYYFGGAYEVTGSNVRKYYSFAGQTVAMRTWDPVLEEWNLTYFLTDHLAERGIIE